MHEPSCYKEAICLMKRMAFFCKAQRYRSMGLLIGHVRRVSVVVAVVNILHFATICSKLQAQVHFVC